MKPAVLRNRPGLTLVELLVIALILGILAFLFIGGLRMLALNDVESVTITGRRFLTDRIPETFSVTVELGDVVNATTNVRVRIFEADIGPDELLDDNVTVIIPAGSRTGTGSFRLRCATVQESFLLFTANDEILSGDDGQDEDETGRVFEIFGTVVGSNEVEGGTGTVFARLFEVECLPPLEPEEE